MNKNNYLVFVLIVVGLVTSLVLATQVVPNVLVTLIKASPVTKISIAESRILGEKILAKADGVDRCVINVFLMDDSNKGVVGKKVALDGASGITVINDVTDSDGKASFAVTSLQEGQYTLNASVGGAPLARGVVVTFRN